MRRQMEHRQQGIFVAEGEKVVRRLLDSKFGVQSVLMPERWLADFAPLLQKRMEDIPVFLGDKELLEKLTGFSMYQGLLAVGRIPGQPPLEEILAQASPPFLLVAVDSLSNAENLGTVVRNCAAFNAHGLIAGETCSSPFLRRAVRSSMGAIFELPVVESGNLAATLAQLKRNEIRCVAAHPRAGGKTLPQADLKGDVCLVFGSEGYGITPAILAVCDEAVAVPMPATVDSLNVGSASGVFLYEVNRQRGRI